ncbi:hypothetical protein G6011_08112 [Alternaria panax]|uniref:Heterokaryon incompatibility domain-containing protein n=1 Tax=Alternaria panax TaxID=48097 RepID=A0AAD4FM23_9PLEO|nr:hypothetical protein G6011_08112 [Alternaria panax]
MSAPSLDEHPQALVNFTPHHPAYSSIMSDNGEIRLLELLPAQHPDDTIQLRLHPKKLDEKRDYEALSYAWGTADSPREASLNGKPIFMRESLDLGLRRLRYTDRSRVLWADALVYQSERYSRAIAPDSACGNNIRFSDDCTVMAWRMAIV